MEEAAPPEQPHLRYAPIPEICVAAMASSGPAQDLLTQEALAVKTADQLRELCRDAGVSSSGRKTELVARLVQSRQFRVQSADSSKRSEQTKGVGAMRLRRPTPPEHTRLLPVQPNLLPPRRRSPPKQRLAPVDPRLQRITVAVQPAALAQPSPMDLEQVVSVDCDEPAMPMFDIEDDYEPVSASSLPEIVVNSEADLERTEPTPGPDSKLEPFDGLSVAFVCHSNLNRSMEAHYLCVQADPFKNKAKNIKSYGAGGRVNLPGTTANNPHVFDFGVAGYADIQKTLVENDREQFYTRLGVLQMIDRNLQVKPKPERWQEEPRHFNLIVCFEQRIFDIVLEDISSRRPIQHRLAHVVNIETPDNFSSAKVGGTLACQLVEMIAQSPDWECEFPALLGIIEQTVQLQHAVVFY